MDAEYINDTSQEGYDLLTSVLDMTIYWYDVEALVPEFDDVEYHFIAITLRSGLTQSGSTCLGTIYK